MQYNSAINLHEQLQMNSHQKRGGNTIGTQCASTEKIPSDVSPTDLNTLSHRKNLPNKDQNALDSKITIKHKDFDQQVLSGPRRELSLRDLEAKFQQECDDLMVSISQNWNTIQAGCDSGRQSNMLKSGQEDYKSNGGEFGDPYSFGASSNIEDSSVP